MLIFFGCFNSNKPEQKIVNLYNQADEECYFKIFSELYVKPSGDTIYFGAISPENIMTYHRSSIINLYVLYNFCKEKTVTEKYNYLFVDFSVVASDTQRNMFGAITSFDNCPQVLKMYNDPKKSSIQEHVIFNMTSREHFLLNIIQKQYLDVIPKQFRYNDFIVVGSHHGFMDDNDYTQSFKDSLLMYYNFLAEDSMLNYYEKDSLIRHVLFYKNLIENVVVGGGGSVPK